MFACSTLLYPAPKKPDWVTKRPVDNTSYTGIGFALKTNPDYMQEAKQQALNDLISEISVEVQGETLMNMVQSDDNFSSSLAQNIKLKAREDLEQFELTDSWGDNKEYRL